MKSPLVLITSMLCLILMMSIGCSSSEQDSKIQSTEASSQNSETVTITKNKNKNLYWGDTHLHTTLSPDAFSQGNRLDPDVAFRFAKGEEVISSPGKKYQLTRPLDFLVVADHAEGLGIGPAILEGNEILMKDKLMRKWRDMFLKGGDHARKAGREMPVAMDKGLFDPAVTAPEVMGPFLMRVWQKYLPTAERHNDPGNFTAFIGYEWTSMRGGNNLHRVVVYRDGIDKAKRVLPFNALQGPDPEDLWKALDRYEREIGGKALAIPHNGNLSNGRMFAMTDYYGNPMTKEYAITRSRWEPLIETTQIKGDGESHPILSPNDEFAGYGDAGWDLGNMTLSELKTPDMLDKEYSRGALKNGLLLETQLGVNPFKFGMIGSTDSHTALATSDENNWSGKFSGQESNPKRAISKDRFFEGKKERLDWQYLASGYAAVWAESNTREDIWDAMKRREVYGTTGPRIQLRFFGGWDFTVDDINSADYVNIGYQKGVPMGSDLLNSGVHKAPTFMIVASKDSEGANLDRVQIIKGWTIGGKTFEEVYDVVWSGDRKIGGNGKLMTVGNTVNVETATYENSIGSEELTAVWLDPDFDDSVHAFYYVRVLEIPTPRWSTYDAARYDFDLPNDIPRTQQERAYSSPIWYTPQ